MREEPVVSGREYSVDEVRGRPAAELEDFEGETSFHASHGPHEHDVVGFGRVEDDKALVHEKQGPDGGGRDVRVWQVTPTAQGFAAEHIPKG
ncbi:hypothetical protein [Kineococcus rhizosphaerae]|uniref:hypothetical protein n=1 Tax=Kineococcus rhizosphaerae TaxID=559628 RepID=UPI0011B263D5|nr:hypothetical protein [Kineococcus rhizosphaerae]